MKFKWVQPSPRDKKRIDTDYGDSGCKPCTTEGKVRAGGGRQGQFERAGRFAGTDNKGQECGLHTT